jgi:hypothetical protein
VREEKTGLHNNNVKCRDTRVVQVQQKTMQIYRHRMQFAHSVHVMNEFEEPAGYKGDEIALLPGGLPEPS